MTQIKTTATVRVPAGLNNIGNTIQKNTTFQAADYIQKQPTNTPPIKTAEQMNSDVYNSYSDRMLQHAEDTLKSADSNPLQKAAASAYLGVNKAASDYEKFVADKSKYKVDMTKGEKHDTGNPVNDFFMDVAGNIVLTPSAMARSVTAGAYAAVDKSDKSKALERFGESVKETAQDPAALTALALTGIASAGVGSAAAKIASKAPKVSVTKIPPMVKKTDADKATVSGKKITITTDKGKHISLSVSERTETVKLKPNSTGLLNEDPKLRSLTQKEKTKRTTLNINDKNGIVIEKKSGIKAATRVNADRELYLSPTDGMIGRMSESVRKIDSGAGKKVMVLRQKDGVTTQKTIRTKYNTNVSEKTLRIIQDDETGKITRIQTKNRIKRDAGKITPKKTVVAQKERVVLDAGGKVEIPGARLITGKRRKTPTVKLNKRKESTLIIEKGENTVGTIDERTIRLNGNRKTEITSVVIKDQNKISRGVKIESANPETGILKQTGKSINITKNKPNTARTTKSKRQANRVTKKNLEYVRKQKEKEEKRRRAEINKDIPGTKEYRRELRRTGNINILGIPTKDSLLRIKPDTPAVNRRTGVKIVTSKKQADRITKKNLEYVRKQKERDERQKTTKQQQATKQKSGSNVLIFKEEQKQKQKTGTKQTGIVSGSRRPAPQQQKPKQQQKQPKPIFAGTVMQKQKTAPQMNVTPKPKPTETAVKQDAAVASTTATTTIRGTASKEKEKITPAIAVTAATIQKQKTAQTQTQKKDNRLRQTQALKKKQKKRALLIDEGKNKKKRTVRPKKNKSAIRKEVINQMGWLGYDAKAPAKPKKMTLK